jgi:hypothetical protein
MEQLEQSDAPQLEPRAEHSLKPPEALLPPVPAALPEWGVQAAH